MDQDASTGHKNHEIRFVKEMNETDIVTWNNIHRKTQNLLKNNDLLHMVALNHDDFRLLLQTILTEFSTTEGFTYTKPIVSINQHIMNILSSAVVFLSHNELNISRRYGKTSKMLDTYKKATSHAYDTHFAYRFLYKLRNFTQHSGTPAINVKFQTKAVPNDPDQTEYSINITLNKEALLSEKERWSTVAAEIDLLPDAIPIIGYIDEFMECIDDIYGIILAADVDEIMKTINDLDAFLQPTYTLKGSPIIADMDEVGFPGRMYDVDLPFVKHILSLLDITHPVFNP